jgi:UDP-N-acetylglucosamine 2-epimerase (non-hydrolysing)
MRALVVIGTRPEAIKLAPVVHTLAAGPGVRVEVCLTSQHTDLIRPMLDFFRVPVDHDLKVMTSAQTLPDVAAKILHGVGAILRAAPYDVVVVQGDTTTAFAGGLAGFYERVRVAHVEAGLRSFDLNHPFPEEAHRRFVDVFADYLFVPTPDARDNLLREGAEARRVFITGNSGIDALLIARDRVTADRRPLPVPVPPDHRLLLVTAHRRESFGPPLEQVFRAVVALARGREDLSVLIPLHPNPNVRAAARVLAGQPRVHVVEPLEYPDFVAAMARADVILTDSGGVQEEAPVLGKPVLVTRETTERPEGVAAGLAELVGTDAGRIVERVTALLAAPAGGREPAFLYGDGSAAARIVQVLRDGHDRSQPARAAA